MNKINTALKEVKHDLSYSKNYRTPKDVIVYDDKTLEDILLEHDERLQSDLSPDERFPIMPQQSDLDLSYVDLQGRDLSHLDLSGVDLHNANLSHTELRFTNLNGAILSFANLNHAYLVGNLDQANLTEASMVGIRMLCCNARQANFHLANLRDAILSCSQFIGAFMYKANLENARMDSADLSYADLSEAFLGHVNLSNADLSMANLSNTRLECSNLNFAKMYGAKIDGANMHGDSLIHTNLYGAIGSLIEYRKGKILRDDIIGYKKCADKDGRQDVIVTLKIPRGSIVFSINGKKCRTNRAIVLDITGADRAYSLSREHTASYYVGDEINIYNFNCQYNLECAEGIHFFMTREEAEGYILK